MRRTFPARHLIDDERDPLWLRSCTMDRIIERLGLTPPLALGTSAALIGAILVGLLTT
jgi:hypothetical protein